MARRPTPVLASGERELSQGITRKIVLGYVVPLVVLLVAGLLIPVLLWAYTGRFKTEYEARVDLVARMTGLVQAVHNVDEAQRGLWDIQDQSAWNEVEGDLTGLDEGPYRTRVVAMRASYRERERAVSEWAKDHGDPVLEERLKTADDDYVTWVRTKSIDFDPIADQFAALQVYAERQRDLWAPRFRRADILRRWAVFLLPPLALVLALLIGRSIALSITQPLQALTRAVREIEEGDMSHLWLPFEHDTDDEFGDLRRAFRSMAKAIGLREAVQRAQNESLGAIGRRMESVLNATNDGIALLDNTGSFSLVNPRFAYFFSREPEELLDQPFSKIGPILLSHFKNRDGARRRLRAVLRDPEVIADESYELTRPSGQILRVFSAPVRREEGEESHLIGRIVVLRDVTRESQVDRMKSEFVSTVSHELRTPLTAIRGYVDLILGGETGAITETQREFLTLTQASVQRLSLLISDMLDISRIEAGGGELLREVVVYRPLIDQAIKMLDGQARAKQITLVSEVPEKLPELVGDPNRITQALVNLLSNSVKYTPSNGRIKLTVSVEGDFVTTTIADNGIGIREADRERIFDKFFRADNSTTRETGGTGLGLAITKAIVERMGGTIWVESAPGAGSIFRFTVPIADSEVLASDDPSRRQLILLVHDDPTLLHRGSHALRGQGMITSGALTAADTLRRARGLRPDIILLDPLTAKFDAMAVLQELRADTHTASVPVLLYTLWPGPTGIEVRDTLTLVAPGRATIQAAVHSSLPTRETGRTRPIIVVGSEATVSAVKAALTGELATIPVHTGTPSEMNQRLGPLRPLLVVGELGAMDGAAFGGFVRSLRERHRTGRIPILLVGALDPRTQLLVPPGTGFVSLDRLARAIRSAL